MSSSQNSHRQYRGFKSVKELAETPAVTAFRARFEAGRSFDLDDDLEFCPGLLTEDDVSLSTPLVPNAWPAHLVLALEHYDDSLDVNIADLQLHSIHSSSSDRSSLSSGSPDSSPLQHQIQPTQQVTPSLSLSSAPTSSYVPSSGFTNTHNQMKLHQPSAVRTRNAIPIVNPSTGMRVPSPPSSISPGMMQQTTATRRW